MDFLLPGSDAQRIVRLHDACPAWKREVLKRKRLPGMGGKIEKEKLWKRQISNH